jgi:hypothetical protein
LLPRPQTQNDLKQHVYARINGVCYRTPATRLPGTVSAATVKKLGTSTLGKRTLPQATMSSSMSRTGLLSATVAKTRTLNWHR